MFNDKIMTKMVSLFYYLSFYVGIQVWKQELKGSYDAFFKDHYFVYLV